MAFSLGKVLSLDQSTSWILAFAATGALGAAVYGIGKWSMKKMEAKRAEEAQEILAELDELARKDAEKLVSEHSEVATEKPYHALDQRPWGYSGSAAPPYWPDIDGAFRSCGIGSMQSPIDIVKSSRNRKLMPLKFYYRMSQLSVRFEHQTVIAAVETGSYLTYEGDTFNLQRILLRTPSEHHLQGLPFEAEIQLEHQNARQEKLILASFLKVVGNAKAVSLFGFPKDKNHEETIAKFPLENLLPLKDRNYFSYTGSLTYPPCTENIRWMIFTEPLPVSSATIDRLVVLQKNNNRPLQKIGKRVVERSIR